MCKVAGSERAVKSVSHLLATGRGEKGPFSLNLLAFRQHRQIRRAKNMQSSQLRESREKCLSLISLGKDENVSLSSNICQNNQTDLPLPVQIKTNPDGCDLCISFTSHEAGQITPVLQKETHSSSTRRSAAGLLAPMYTCRVTKTNRAGAGCILT